MQSSYCSCSLNIGLPHVGSCFAAALLALGRCIAVAPCSQLCRMAMLSVKCVNRNGVEQDCAVMVAGRGVSNTRAHVSHTLTLHDHMVYFECWAKIQWSLRILQMQIIRYYAVHNNRSCRRWALAACACRYQLIKLKSALLPEFSQVRPSRPKKRCGMCTKPGSLLFHASLQHAAGLKTVLDLLDKDYSQDAGTVYRLPVATPILLQLHWQVSDTQLTNGNASVHMQYHSESAKMACRYT